MLLPGIFAVVGQTGPFFGSLFCWGEE